MAEGQWTGWLQRCRESRSLVLVIVAIALLLDNMLLTTVGKLLVLSSSHLYCRFIVFDLGTSLLISNHLQYYRLRRHSLRLYNGIAITEFFSGMLKYL